MKVIIIATNTGLAVIVMMGKTLVINLIHAQDKTTGAVVTELELMVVVEMGKTPHIVLLMRRQKTTARATTEMPVKSPMTIAVVIVIVTQTLTTTKREDHEHTFHSLNEATRCFSHPLKCQSAPNLVHWSGGTIQTMTRN